MKMIGKIQGLPLGTRKIILWATVVIFGFVLLFIWIKSIQNKVRSFDGEGNQFMENLNLQGMEMPVLGIPDNLEQEIKEIEEEIKRLEQAEEI